MFRRAGLPRADGTHRGTGCSAWEVEAAHACRRGTLQLPERHAARSMQREASAAAHSITQRRRGEEGRQQERGPAARLRAAGERGCHSHTGSGTQSCRPRTATGSAAALRCPWRPLGASGAGTIHSTVPGMPGMQCMHKHACCAGGAPERAVRALAGRGQLPARPSFRRATDARQRHHPFSTG
jgi:hypothetical protein